MEFKLLQLRNRPSLHVMENTNGQSGQHDPRNNRKHGAPQVRQIHTAQRKL